MAKSVRELLRLHNVEGAIGVEIEMEGENLPHHVPYWKNERDGSLRGESIEYILQKPMELEEVKKSLSALEDSLKENKASVKDTYRAGVHVHLNVQDKTLAQVFTIGCCYLVLEKLLTNWCAPSRVGNHFCLRASDAEGLTYYLRRFLIDEDWAYLNSDGIRYSGINFKSVTKLGSLEFRTLESTTNFNKIYVWARMLNSIKVFSERFENPVDFIEWVKAKGTEHFLSQCLGVDYMRLECSNAKQYMKEGLRHAQDLAYAREWNSSNLNIFKKSSRMF